GASPMRQEPREQRILCVWWPSLAIERWRRTSGLPPDSPVVLTLEGAHGPVIAAASPAAAAKGARAGARLTDARALDPGLVAVPADPVGDKALVGRLARWAARWSPLVEVDGPDGLRLDVSGVAHLFGGEAALVEDVRRRFAALGLSSRVAVAPTPGAAWALARSGGGICSKDLAATLAPLPVAALRLSPQAVRTLERLGFKTIGALAGVPRRALARRFREADNPLDALDRALGRKPEPLVASRYEPPPRASFGLAEPASDPAVLRQALDRLAGPLVGELVRRRLGARRIAFHAFRVDGEVGEAEAETALPTRDPAHIARLLGDKVAGLDPGFGFDGFALTARWCEPLDPAQDALLGEPPGELELARLVDRLVARLGPGRVRRPVRRDSHLPERASGWAEALDNRPPPPPASGRGSRPPSPAQRPERLLDRPEAIAVVYATPEGVPRRFVWRRVVHDIARVEGPERIAPEWWRAPARARLRDYYRVEDQSGRRFWIYREGLAGDGRGGAPAWYLHGLFG
ncbi:MAG TPA: DUF6504 family protein, partial [Sphingomicrobium sp.]|nr:DUF6504 family protein [Sphingomicrobium sp.]